LSYSSCDEMIKKSPTKIGLRELLVTIQVNQNV